MSFFIGKNDKVFDELTSAENLMKADPDYYAPRFEAIAELRAQDDGTLHRGQEFRRVASLVNVPLFHVARLMDPGWMKVKKNFYAWLKKHPQYKTYDTKGGSRPSLTYLGGKAVGGADGS